MKNFTSSTIFLFLLAITVSFFIPSSAMAAEDLDIHAKAALLIEADNGQVLYAKNENEKIYPASVTKIMTVLLGIEAVQAGTLSLDDTVTAPDNIYYDVTEDSSTQKILPGETLSFHDVLRCALIASANEACNLIADCVSGDINTFVALMNTRASELGCTGTHFTNTHGMPDDNHYTTAQDIYRIFSEAIKHQEFTDISATAVYEVPATNMSEPRKLENTNKLLLQNSPYYYKYATGGKTGTTTAAGLCLVTTADYNSRKLISIVMGAQPVVLEDNTTDAQNFSETIRLLKWGFNNFSYQTILDTAHPLAEVPVLFGSGADSVVLSPKEPITILLDQDINTEDFWLDIEIYGKNEDGKLTAPITAGSVMGKASLYYGDDLYGTVDLVANSSISLAKIEQINNDISSFLAKPVVQVIIIALVMVLPFYFVFTICYNFSRRKKAEAKQSKEDAFNASSTIGKTFEEIESLYTASRRKK